MIHSTCTLHASREQRIEASNGFADKLRDSIQAWQEWFALENPLFIQRYKEGELHVLLKFSTGLIPQKYVIVFEGKADVGQDNPWTGSFPLCEQMREHARQMHSEISPDDCNWKPMF